MLTDDSLSIAEEDFRDLVRPDTRAGNGPMIGQEDDRAPDIEETDHVVVIGDATAPVRDVTQTTAEREQLFALGGTQVRKDIRDPAEAIANWRAVVGCAGGKGRL